MTTGPETPELVEHLFRHHYGRLVAGLTGVFGVARLDDVEDVAQEALLRALKQWPFEGIPSRPDAWLTTVARNLALDRIRHQAMHRRHEDALEGWARRSVSASSGEADEEITDGSLRLIFTCCHPVLPRASQVALTLKTLCGFGVPEIGAALLSLEATVAQRLVRAKATLGKERVSFEVPAGAALRDRLDVVLDVLYSLFNEGYSAHVGDALVRRDLVSEALRLTTLLVQVREIATPTVHALLALMHLLRARLPARVSASGALLPLREQDRELWDRKALGLGFAHFAQAAQGESMTAFHVEAAIASVHAMAVTYDQTDWPRILKHYDVLFSLRPTAVVRLNRAVALAKVHGVAVALPELEALDREGTLARYHLLPATLGYCLWAMERRGDALEQFDRAASLTSISAERAILAERARSCRAGDVAPDF